MKHHTIQLTSEPNRNAYRLLIAIWAIGVVSGFSLIISHNFAASNVSSAPIEWPTGINLEFDANHPTLLVFIHPQCPCSSATIAELERLLAEVNEVKCTILMGCPSDQVDQWMRSKNAERCKSIEGVQMVVDVDGTMAAKFDATTSGHCLLYSVTGKLMFQGGITTERGHEGESCGRVAIRNLIARNPGTFDHAPVFGCELVRTSEKSESGLVFRKETLK